jgi:very-short-patch-repair endonuclease
MIMGKLEIHNREIMETAEFRANQMKIWPSPLEEKMQEFLEENNVDYECQKIFYIYAEDGWIIRYYIADFYIPSVDLILEVDGKFHDEHKLHDKERTKTIQENYPEVEVYRWRWKDFKDRYKVEELLSKLDVW